MIDQNLKHQMLGVNVKFTLAQALKVSNDISDYNRTYRLFCVCWKLNLPLLF